jgi:hypothetical protein
MTDSPSRFFDSRSAIAAVSDLYSGHRTSRPPLPSPSELETLRAKAIRDGCIYVAGKQGKTVFRFGPAEPHHSLSTDLEEYTARVIAAQPSKPKKKRLVPGVGYRNTH